MRCSALFKFIITVGSVFKVFGVQNPWHLSQHKLRGRDPLDAFYAFFGVSRGPLRGHGSNTWTKEAMELFKPHNQPDSALLFSPHQAAPASPDRGPLLTRAEKDLCLSSLTGRSCTVSKDTGWANAVLGTQLSRLHHSTLAPLP